MPFPVALTLVVVSLLAMAVLSERGRHVVAVWQARWATAEIRARLGIPGVKGSLRGEVIRPVPGRSSGRHTADRVGDGAWNPRVLSGGRISGVPAHAAPRMREAA